jgi:RNA polymerase sigma-70 factor, ECF subfamily
LPHERFSERWRWGGDLGNEPADALKAAIRPARTQIEKKSGAIYKDRVVTVIQAEHVSETASNWCEALYGAQVSGLILYGRALGLGHSEAEDVVQEVFTALLRLDERPEQPERYLIRAFRNRAFNRRVSLWRRVSRELESHRWFEPPASAPAQELAAMRCLSHLPAEQREVIVLKVWHEMTFDEIAQLQGLSPNTVAGRYRYGLQKMRACLKEQSHELEDGENDAILGAPSANGPAA